MERSELASATFLVLLIITGGLVGHWRHAGREVHPVLIKDKPVAVAGRNGTPAASILPSVTAGSVQAATGIPPFSAAQPATPKYMDINLATLDDLQETHLIGPKLAQAIIDERSRCGGFTSMDNLTEIEGVGPKRLGLLKERFYIAVPTQRRSSQTRRQ